MGNKWRNWVRTGALALVGLVLGVNIYLWNARNLTGNAMPMPFGVGAAVVLSGSMEPALSVNDLVFVRESESYETGDIIVYQSGGTLVIHRIVGIDGETVTARGDANNADDSPILLSDIKGELVFTVPAVGGLARALKSLPGVAVLVAGSLFLLEKSRSREKKKDEEELDAIKAQIRALKQELEREGQG